MLAVQMGSGTELIDYLLARGVSPTETDTQRYCLVNSCKVLQKLKAVQVERIPYCMFIWPQRPAGAPHD